MRKIKTKEKGDNLKRKTMIVSAFAGCGKTYLSNFGNTYSFRDSESSNYEKTKDWETRYVDDIVKDAESGKYDFIFICQTESVLDEIDKRNIPYVIVEPDNLVRTASESPERQKERQLIKQQWFGRFLLRDNSHIKDFDRWLAHINDIYDDRTGHGFLERHKQKTFFLLKQDQYLSNIIDDLYWKKENNTQLCYKRTGAHTI